MADDVEGMLRGVVQFAYKQGFHEHGFDLVSTFREREVGDVRRAAEAWKAAAFREKELLEMANAEHAAALSRVREETLEKAGDVLDDLWRIIDAEPEIAEALGDGFMSKLRALRAGPAPTEQPMGLRPDGNDRARCDCATLVEAWWRAKGRLLQRSHAPNLASATVTREEVDELLRRIHAAARPESTPPAPKDPARSGYVRFRDEAESLMCNVLGRQLDPNWRPDKLALDLVASVLESFYERGKAARPDASCGVCGREVGDPEWNGEDKCYRTTRPSRYNVSLCDTIGSARAGSDVGVCDVVGEPHKRGELCVNHGAAARPESECRPVGPEAVSEGLVGPQGSGPATGNDQPGASARGKMAGSPPDSFDECPDCGRGASIDNPCICHAPAPSGQEEVVPSDPQAKQAAAPEVGGHAGRNDGEVTPGAVVQPAAAPAQSYYPYAGWLPPKDAPEGQCWKCPDCESWATLRGNAHAHQMATGHGHPTLAKQPDPIPPGPVGPKAVEVSGAATTAGALEQVEEVTALKIHVAKLQRANAHLAARAERYRKALGELEWSGRHWWRRSDGASGAKPQCPACDAYWTYAQDAGGEDTGEPRKTHRRNCWLAKLLRDCALAEPEEGRRG